MDKRAFSLLELLVVIAIIGIIGAIAVPQYQTYTVRAQIMGALQRAKLMQRAIEKNYSLNGSMDRSDGYQPEINQLTSSSISYGWVGSPYYYIGMGFSSSINPAVNGKQLTLKASLDPNSGIITWKCQAQFNYPVPCKYLPQSCIDSNCP